ncbi:hypothetical protein pb186bvf_013995 [Paramecium bursaria]
MDYTFNANYIQQKLCDQIKSYEYFQEQKNHQMKTALQVIERKLMIDNVSFPVFLI